MNFDKYYVVLLKEGSNTTPIDAADLKRLQEAHRAHLTHLKKTGHLSLAGPAENHSDP